MAAAGSVSVVVTTFNHGQLVVDAIGSVLAQTHPPAEIIVIDDGSTDGTQRRLEEEFGGRVRCVWQPNAGIAGSRNRGVEETSGELIALMDGDDLWHVRKLEWQADALRRYPESGIVSVRPLLFDSESIPSTLAWELEQPSITCRDCLAELLEDDFLATTSQVAVPRAVLQVVGGSDPRYRLCSDFDLYCRIARRYPVTMVEAPLALWRYRADSASGDRLLRELNWGPEMVEILRKALDTWDDAHRPLLQRALRHRVRTLGWHAYRHGVRAGRVPAASVLRGLLRRYPTEMKLWAYWLAIRFPTLATTLSRNTD